MIDHPDDLTAEWLTAILRAANGDAQVHSVTVEPIGTGQTGASFRLHLDGDGEVPSTLVAKTAAGDRPLATRRRRVPQRGGVLHRVP